MAEARRVLADDGTCWLNLGDSYSVGGGAATGIHAYLGPHLTAHTVPGMLAKSLLGLPWRVAFALHDDGWILRGWLSRLFQGRPKVGPQQARELLARGAILLDVRENAEWRAGHAPEARHIPLSRLQARMGDAPPNRTLVTVCRSGARSARAAALLARQGRDVRNLTGGMHAWARAGLPVVAQGGRPGRVV